MTKAEFTDRVAAKSGLSKRDATKAVDAFLDSITEALRRWRASGVHRLRQVLAPAPQGAAGREPPHRREGDDPRGSCSEVLRRQPAEASAQAVTPLLPVKLRRGPTRAPVSRSGRWVCEHTFAWRRSSPSTPPTGWSTWSRSGARPLQPRRRPARCSRSPSRRRASHTASSTTSSAATRDSRGGGRRSRSRTTRRSSCRSKRLGTSSSIWRRPASGPAAQRSARSERSGSKA